MTLRGYIAAIFGLALFQGACAPDSAVGRPRAFDEVVFGRGPVVDRLARWRVPVRIAVSGRPWGDQGSRLDRVLAVIDAATGHGIALVGNRATANVVLFFDDGAGYLASLRERGGVEDPARQAAITLEMTNNGLSGALRAFWGQGGYPGTSYVR